MCDFKVLHRPLFYKRILKPRYLDEERERHGGASMEVAYSASKAAVIGFTKALAKEVAPMGVLVNAVAPGAVDTDMMSVYTSLEKEELCRDSIPLARLATPSEIAKAILYLAESGYCVGSVLSITAGL